MELKMFHYMIFSSVLFMTALRVQGRCKKPIVDGNRVLTDKSSLISNFTNGTTVTFKCSVGYTTVNGSRSITCNGSHWTELELLCKRKPCMHPGEILHGSYSMPEGILFGATITAHCDEGYRLASTTNIRTCRAFGWDGKELSCEAVKCPNPPPVLNGSIENIKNWYDYGEVVTYSCKGGRFLKGSNMLTCSADETFKPEAPQCLDVLCEAPDIQNADKVEGKTPPYTYGNFLHYECNEGYVMKGFGRLICTEHGWSPPPPTCDPVTCSKPHFASQGDVYYAPVQEVYKYGQTIKCSCATGFKLRGAQRISCAKDGTFQPSPPECLEVTCDEPYVDKAVIIEGKAPRYVYNQSIRYQCEEGYRIEGFDYLTCMETGWTLPPPRCHVVTCDVVDVKNAVIVKRKSSYQYQNVIHYKCDKGYIMNGFYELACTEHGWSLPPPMCNVVTCDVVDVKNAVIVKRKSSYQYQNVIHYKCDKGYIMNGFYELTCTEHGWSFPPPMCNDNRVAVKILIGVLVGVAFGAVVGVVWLIAVFIGVAYHRTRNKKASKQVSREENENEEILLHSHHGNNQCVRSEV